MANGKQDESQLKITSTQNRLAQSLPHLKENIKKVEKLLVLEVRRIWVLQIIEELKISNNSWKQIVYNYLLISKVSMHWVIKMLSPLDWHRREESSRDFLRLFKNHLKATYHGFISTNQNSNSSQYNGWKTYRARSMFNGWLTNLWQQCLG